MTSQAHRQANLLSDCVNSLKLWKDLINEYLDGEEKTAEMRELEQIVKDYCIIENEATKASEACEEVVEYLSDETNNQEIDLDQLYKEKLSNKTTSTNYQNHTIWNQIFNEGTDQDVEEVEQNRNETQEDPEYEEMQDSIFYSNIFTPPVDPISKMVIKEPFKSSSCGHIYERKFIFQYVKSMKNKAKCPYIGCSNKNLTINELIEDSETQQKIEDYLKTNTQENDEDD